MKVQKNKTSQMRAEEKNWESERVMGDCFGWY